MASKLKSVFPHLKTGMVLRSWRPRNSPQRSFWTSMHLTSMSYHEPTLSIWRPPWQKTKPDSACKLAAWSTTVLWPKENWCLVDKNPQSKHQLNTPSVFLRSHSLGLRILIYFYFPCHFMVVATMFLFSAMLFPLSFYFRYCVSFYQSLPSCFVVAAVVYFKIF